MVTADIKADIETIEQNTALYEEINFASRLEAIDFLEFHVLDRIESLLQSTNAPQGLLPLQQHAERIKAQLEEIDAALFQQLRVGIRTGQSSGKTLRNLIRQYVEPGLSNSPLSQEIGYDALDAFTNGLFPAQPLPSETREREAEMVFYQKTPARIIFELVERARLTNEDVFYDVGSGLGQVPMLVSLLSGATAKGVEVEPAYCAYARLCAADLNLAKVTFIEADARRANYSDGTVFFMYTPFEGRMLHEMLELIRSEARHRKVRLFTYGPCTLPISRLDWLKCVNEQDIQVYRLCEFKSLPAA